MRSTGVDGAEADWLAAHAPSEVIGGEQTAKLGVLVGLQAAVSPALEQL